MWLFAFKSSWIPKTNFLRRAKIFENVTSLYMKTELKAWLTLIFIFEFYMSSKLGLWFDFNATGKVYFQITVVNERTQTIIRRTLFFLWFRWWKLKILWKKCLLQEKASAPDESLKQNVCINADNADALKNKCLREKARRSRDKKYMIVIHETKSRMTFASDHTLHASLYLSNKL